MDFRECNRLVATIDEAMEQLRDVRYCLFALVIAAYIMICAKVCDYYFTCIRRPAGGERGGPGGSYQYWNEIDNEDTDDTVRHSPNTGRKLVKMSSVGLGETDPETGRWIPMSSHDWQSRQTRQMKKSITGEDNAKCVEQRLTRVTEESYREMSNNNNVIRSRASRSNSVPGSPTDPKKLYCECKSPVFVEMKQTPDGVIRTNPDRQRTTSGGGLVGIDNDAMMRTSTYTRYTRSHSPTEGGPPAYSDTGSQVPLDLDLDGKGVSFQRVTGLRYPPIHQSSI